MNSHRKLNLLPLLLLLFILVSAAFGQFAQRGAIGGTVLDSTGAAVPNAQVTLIDVDHNENRTVSADSQGNYQFAGLVAGPYRLTAGGAGFQTAKSDQVDVSIGTTIRYDFKLTLGSVSQTVTVTSDAPLLNTETANVGVEITTQQFQELPMSGLNFTALAALVPGGATSPENIINPGGSFAVGAQFASGGVAFTSGGVVQGSRDSGFYINGVNTNDNYESSLSYLPASNALQNAKFDVFEFSAANGRDMSTFSIQTKSGTTKYHGAAYEFLQNDFLNATNPYDKAYDPSIGATAVKPTLRRNQFGGGFGGPIPIPGDWKNRLFFFANYEEFIERDGSVQVAGSVPSANERTGDFSELCQTGFDSNGLCIPAPPNSPLSAVQIYNPFTTTYDGSGNSTRLPIPNNRLDLAINPITGNPVIDPTTAPLLKIYPLPNLQGQPSNVNNLLTTQTEGFNNYHFDSRFDANLTKKDSIFVTWSRQHGTNNNSGGIFPEFPFNNDDKSYLVTANEVHTFSPTLTNEFIFGIGSASLTIVSPSTVAFANSSANPLNSAFQNTGLGITHGLLAVYTNNYATPGIGQDFLASNRTFQISDNVNWVHGRHAMTFGMNYFRKAEYDWDFGRNVYYGSFSSGGYDQGYAGGDSIADMIMGLPSYIHQLNNIVGGDATAPELNVIFPQWGMYGNDKIKINQKLTVSLGLRYDLNIPVYDPNKYCCAVYQPDANGGVMALPGVAPGLPQHYLSAPKLDFAPRLSIAYALRPKQLIHAGYGIFYNMGGSQISTAVGFANNGSPASNGSNLFCLTDTPCLTQANVFQPEPNIPQGQYPVSTGMGQGYFGDGAWQNVIYSDKKSTSVPYYQRYTVDFEQELNPSSSFTVSYVGAQGRKGMNLVNINLPPYQTGWSSSDAYNAARPNNSGRFGDIYVQRPNLNSFYNAAIVSFKHRFSNSWQATSSYTFSKTVSDYPWINNLAYNGAAGGGANYLAFGSGFQYPNIYNRGESSLSHRHRFVFSGIWTPVYGAGWSSWARAPFTGWRLSGIVTLESGNALTVTDGGPDLGGTSALDYAGPDELSVSGNPNLSHGSKSFSSLFNTAAFTAPPMNVRGDSGLGTVRGPGLNNMDLSLAKNFKVRESITANLRLDAFNALNHTQWTGAQTIYPNDSNGIPFGQATGAREARIAQISFKLSF